MEERKKASARRKAKDTKSVLLRREGEKIVEWSKILIIEVSFFFGAK